jgi:hypothetical protein
VRYRGPGLADRRSGANPPGGVRADALVGARAPANSARGSRRAKRIAVTRRSRRANSSPPADDLTAAQRQKLRTGSAREALSPWTSSSVSASEGFTLASARRSGGRGALRATPRARDSAASSSARRLVVVPSESLPRGARGARSRLTWSPMTAVARRCATGTAAVRLDSVEHGLPVQATGGRARDVAVQPGLQYARTGRASHVGAFGTFRRTSWKGLGRPTAPGAIVASKSMRWRPLSAVEASRHNLGLRRARSTTA